ncbi:MAG: DNA polymerase III subunit delta [Candidatus Rifleibacteriota bacterium]
MDIAAFENQIKSGKLEKQILIFSGPEEFLKERMLQKIMQHLVEPDDQPENLFRLDCSGRDNAIAEHQIYSFSFNPSPRIFWFSSFASLNSGPRKSFLAQLAKNGLPMNTILIFDVTDNKVANEISGSFKQDFEKIDFWRPFENQIPAWVKKEAAELGGRINNDAVDLLIDLTGASLAILFQELNKLIIASPDKPVTVDQVKKSVRYLNQDNIFDFLNNFGSRKTREALRALEILINGGEAPQKIWFMLCRQLREYRLFHELATDRPDLFAEAREILVSYARIADKSDFKANQEKKTLTGRLQKIGENLPEFLVKATSFNNPGKIKNLYLATNFNHSELVKAWPYLIKTDLLLKSGVPDPLATLQTFTTKFLAGSLTT